MAADLFEYLKQTQRLLRDGNQELINPADMMDFINRSRRQVALQAQCIRFVPPISGGIRAVTVTNGGSGYTSPTVVFSAPDFPSGAQTYPQGAQAVGTATIDGSGAIVSVNIVFGGDGYFQPSVSITDPTGTGFAATVETSPISVTTQGQEVYPFSQFPLDNAPGVDGIYNIRSVSFLYANWRYTCMSYSFSEYQAHIRRYPQDYQYVPAVISQLGQGKAGSLYMYPIANSRWQFEADCICSPADLVANTSVEALPEPWTDAIPFLAAKYCYDSLQNWNAARYMLDQFDNFMHRYSAGVRVAQVPNRYGRY